MYAVRAYLGDQKSSYSAVDMTVDLGRVSVSLKVVDSSVQLDWNEINGAEGYYIYRKTEDEDEYTLVSTIDDVSVISYIDEQVENGKTYYYAIRAFLGDEQSNYAGSAISISSN